MSKKKVRTRKSRKKPEVAHEYLSLRVDQYHVSAVASINSDVYAPEYAIRLDLDDPLYRFELALVISGTGLYPKDREDHGFEIRIYGDDAPSKQMDLQLQNVQERGEHGSPEYRIYRKQEIPVFRQIKGMALLSKVRGEARWEAWIVASTRFIGDALLVLKEERTRYISIHEVKEGRNRWIRNISVQTSDPAEE